MYFVRIVLYACSSFYVNYMGEGDIKCHGAGDISTSTLVFDLISSLILTTFCFALYNNHVK